MRNLLLAFLIGTFIVAQAQKTEEKIPEHLKELVKMEDSLNVLSKIMITGQGAKNRVKASYAFFNLLEKALKDPASYEYPFDSLYRISIKTAPDKAFKLYTWELLMGESHYRHLGILQVKDKKGSVLYTLNDFSDNIKNYDTIANHEKWYGAYYYNVIMRKHRFKKKYYLFGWDLYNGQSYRKIIDVLTLTKDGPVFGADVFEFEDYNMTKSKILLEYKKDAGITCNYFPEFKKIMFDHLVPLDEKAKEILAIPDGSYEGFFYKKGKWHYMDKVFDYKLQDGQAPNG